MPLNPGQILTNRYRIIKLLGEGGMGAVYAAWDLNLKRQRALKENLDVSPEAQRQFEREAQFLSDLTHPNLPKVIDYFIIPGQGQYLVMEFVDGEDIREKLKNAGTPLPETLALDWIGQICAALYYLHSQNPPVIHRDIKPSNIKITPQGKAMLVDFGIARVYDPSLSTTVGAKAVTPGYAPIEQYGSGQHTSPASDIYALGATLYTLLSRQTPPSAPDRNSGAVLPSLRMINPAVTPGTEAAVLKAMDMQPQERFGSAVEFATALNLMPPVAPLKQPPARSARLYSCLTVGGLIVLLLGLIYLFLKDRGLQPPPPTQTSTNYTTFSPTSSIKPPTKVSETPPAVTQTDTSIERIETTVSPTPTITSSSTPAKSLVLPMDAKLGDTLPRPADGMIMIYISPGEFEMGSSDSDVDALPGEKPQHTVYLDEYWIDRTEVTNAQYALCVAAGKCQLPSESVSESRSSYYGDAPYIDYPVIYVSWEDAAAYCEWAGGRLPTEAEWEKAARGADGRIYPWGDQQPNCQLTNYKGCNIDTSEVGSFPEGNSQYGLSDMAGNVWEWVQDWFDESYYAGSPYSNPAGPPFGQFRVLRGGGYYDDGINLRSTFRNTSFPDITFRGFGFRCAASPAP